MRQLTHISVPEKITRERVQEIAALRISPATGEVLSGQSWPCAPAALVRIFEATKEWSIPMWLCPAAVAQRKAEGWKMSAGRAPPFDDLACDVHRGCACPSAAR